MKEKISMILAVLNQVEVKGEKNHELLLYALRQLQQISAEVK